MELEEVLARLAWTCNRSLGQTKFLFDLCEGDVLALLGVEAYMRREFIHSCPNSKEVVQEYLVAWEVLRAKDKEKKNLVK